MFSRQRQTGHRATAKEANFDFYLGYVACAVLAVLFIALGALVMHGTGTELAKGGVGFSRQFVGMYTATIGEWSHGLILTAAFITIFSTTLTVMDGYPRALAACTSILGKLDLERFRKVHQIWMLLAAILSAGVILFFVKNLLQMLGVASMIAFVTSPVLAYINFKVMSGDNVPEDMRPGPILRLISWVGMLFFAGLAIGFVYVKYM